MSRLLESLGHDVIAAADVRSALREAEAARFDLVLSDLGLPDGSGLDLMRRLKDQYGLTGIAISGYGMEDDLRHSEQAGFIAHLTKPINFHQIEAVLAQAASRAG
jgi:CheY-like chemotaxis protein